MVEGTKELSGFPFYKIKGHWSPSWRLHPYDLITFQRPYLWIPSYWEVGFKHEFGMGDMTISSLAPLSVFFLCLCICICVYLKVIKKGSFLLVLQVGTYFQHLSLWFIFCCFLGKTHSLTRVVVIHGLPRPVQPPVSTMALTLPFKASGFSLQPTLPFPLPPG